MYSIKNPIKLYSLLFFSSLLFVGLFAIFTTGVQAEGTQSPPRGTIVLSPKFPTPGQTVQARFYSASLDQDTALITWRLNGEIIQQAYSETVVTYKVGEIGTVSKLSVTAEDAKGFRVTVESVSYVSDVAIVWEGSTYTPPFYSGKALQTPGSEVTLVALPSVADSKGNLYDKNDLVYMWSINNSSVPVVSGKGKHSVTLKNSNAQTNFLLTLLVKDPQGNTRAAKLLEIPLSQPKIVLYEDSPLIGIRYDKAIEHTYGIFDREATIVAEPYFTTASNRTDPVLKYTWSVANVEYTKPGSITLGSEGAGSGSTYLSLIIKNTKYWLQSGRADLEIEFGKSNAWGSDVNPDTESL